MSYEQQSVQKYTVLGSDTSFSSTLTLHIKKYPGFLFFWEERDPLMPPSLWRNVWMLRVGNCLLTMVNLNIKCQRTASARKLLRTQMLSWKFNLWGFQSLDSSNPELKKVQERSPIQNCRPKMFPEMRKSHSIIKATKQRKFHIIAHYSSKKFPSHYHIEI